MESVENIKLRAERHWENFKYIYVAIIIYIAISSLAMIFIPEGTNGDSNKSTIISGIVGGFGTLLAVLVSTNQTRQIQEDNKREIKQIQEDNKEENRKAQDIEKKSRLRKERKEFGDDIAVLVGRYITDSSVFFHSDIKKDFFSNHIDTAKITGNIDLYNKLEMESLKYIISIDRKIAVECFFILKIKLKDIKLAENLLVKLDLIHKEVYKNEGDPIGNNEWEDYIQELQDLTRKFIDDYVNEVDSLSL